MRYLMLALSLLVAACAATGKPLPLVGKNDPTWNLAPDHLEALPK